MAYSPVKTSTERSVVSSGHSLDGSRTDARPTRFSIDDDYWVEELIDPDMIAAVAEDWDDLTAHAARPNVFFERWMFEAAWPAFRSELPDDGKVVIAVVYRRGQASQFPPVPIGLFPCIISKDLGPLIGPVLSIWDHPYCFDTTPLLREGATYAAVSGFFRWASARWPTCKIVRLNDVAADGPLQTAFVEWQQASRAVSFDFGARNRAALFRSANYDAYIERAISASTRRELRRQARRLADVGVVETSITTDPDDIADWAERFLRLEETGWKKSTAMNCGDSDAQFFREMTVAAAERGQFEGLELRLDGRAVAMKCNIRSCRPVGVGKQTDVAFKIAYDETFKKFSPGVLLELENIKHFHDTDSAGWMDSCAKSNHPMIDRLWGDRAPRSDLLVANGGMWPRAMVGAMHLVRCVRRLRPRRKSPTPTANF